MQQRIPVKLFDTFSEAHAAKEKLGAENPEVSYQIRRNSTKFALVRRFPVNKINSYEETNGRNKHRSSKRKRGIDPAFLQEVRSKT